MNFLIRLLVNAAGFLTAIVLVPGIQTTSKGAFNVAVVCLVASLINTVLGPILRFFTFPFIVFTLGLGLLLVNMAVFWFAGSFGRELGLGFTVNGFWATFFGAIIVSLVSSFFGSLLSSHNR